MPKPVNKLFVWGNSTTDPTTNDVTTVSYDSTTHIADGLEAGNYLEADLLNTIVRNSSLITYTLIESLLTGPNIQLTDGTTTISSGNWYDRVTATDSEGNTYHTDIPALITSVSATLRKYIQYSAIERSYTANKLATPIKLRTSDGTNNSEWLTGFDGSASENTIPLPSTIIADLTGTADKATNDADGNAIKSTYAHGFTKSANTLYLKNNVSPSAGTLSQVSFVINSGGNIVSTGSVSGNIMTLTLGNSGVSAGSYGDTTNQTPAFGSTFKVPSFTINAKGITTLAGEHTVTIPSFASTLSWDNGSTSGPVGKIKDSNSNTLITLDAIPSASTSISGIVTTGDQNFAGNKGFSNIVKIGTSNTFATWLSSDTSQSTFNLTLKITPTPDYPPQLIIGVKNIQQGLPGQLENYSYPQLTFNNSKNASRRAFINSTIEPSSNSSFNLGSFDYHWDTIFADNIGDSADRISKVNASEVLAYTKIEAGAFNLRTASYTEVEITSSGATANIVSGSYDFYLKKKNSNTYIHLGRHSVKRTNSTSDSISAMSRKSSAGGTGDSPVGVLLIIVYSSNTQSILYVKDTVSNSNTFTTTGDWYLYYRKVVN